jgi:hypothetical protein
MLGGEVSSSSSQWAFLPEGPLAGAAPLGLEIEAVYLASRDGYEDSVLPSGLPIGTPQQALDCACGLYLGDPTAWQQPSPPANS